MTTFGRLKSFKTANYNLELFPTLITIIGIIILISLGIWQLCRLKEKNLFIAQLTNTLNNQATPYNPTLTQYIYNKITLKGHFLDNKNVHLYGRKSMSIEKDGYYLLSPFQTNEGKVILVARGWFAAKNKAQVVDIRDNLDEELVGIILPSEQKKFFISANDIKNNVWFMLDLNEIAKSLNIKLEDFYLLQIDPHNLPAYLKPLKAEGLVKIKNDHLEYAMTWFSLAICLGIIFIIYYRHKTLKV